ncbi:cysteine desulfurase family protein [Dethiobacter alkaliphilus]|uniref:Aminotransferase class V n=1 Tax=Dethiobacter alkaliphilus AHT 1 TaxID=555088 RepID=C0GIE0_DETAL|nr:cysteine desulfurase family protein [Dethiobacter alkaliphilus]EEG76988.1 aminotransferase class V [Dethiobacter alkaliphilus AHT 1]
MREIYLDNSATTKVLPEVAGVIQDVLTKEYGNPSSLHRMGVAAERVKTEARRTIAGGCGVKESEIYFTSGGTEANNLAIKGAARRNRRRGNHLVTSKIEHPSVLYAFRALEDEGFSVTYLDVNQAGQVNPEDAAAAVGAETILMSLMHVNNEVGAIQPVEEIGRRIKEKNSDVLYHVDAVQSFGKLPVRPSAWHADLVSFSAHKIHGPKGAGALWRRNGVHLEPLLHGGGQEDGLRPGTENMAGIAGFAAAARLALKSREKNFEHLQNLKSRFLAGLEEHISEVTHNGSGEDAPHILNVTVAGIKGEVLVHALEEQGVYISTGSACHSHRPDPSHVLLAMGLKEEEIGASLRFSFSSLNTETDIDQTLEILEQTVESIRLMTRR